MHNQSKILLVSGLKEAVDWLVSSLQDVIEEIGEDESDVPLLPLADYSVTAMDNDMFQKLLLALGIKRPEDFQVIFFKFSLNYAGCFKTRIGHEARELGRFWDVHVLCSPHF